MCVLMAASACRKVGKRKGFQMSSQGNNQKHIMFHSSQLNPVFLSLFLISFLFPQTAAHLVSLLFSTELTHAHFLRFCPLWAAE